MTHLLPYLPTLSRHAWPGRILVCSLSHFVQFVKSKIVVEKSICAVVKCLVVTNWVSRFVSCKWLMQYIYQSHSIFKFNLIFPTKVPKTFFISTTMGDITCIVESASNIRIYVVRIHSHKTKIPLLAKEGGTIFRKLIVSELLESLTNGEALKSARLIVMSVKLEWRWKLDNRGIFKTQILPRFKKTHC